MPRVWNRKSLKQKEKRTIGHGTMKRGNVCLRDLPSPIGVSRKSLLSVLPEVVLVTVIAPTMPCFVSLHFVPDRAFALFV